MSTKNESAKLTELKEQSVRLIKEILDKKSTDGSSGGNKGDGGDKGNKGGIDTKEKGVTGPRITGIANFDGLLKFLIKNPSPVDPTIKKKLEMVYKYINTDSPDTTPSITPNPIAGPNPGTLNHADDKLPSFPVNNVDDQIKSVANALNITIRRFQNIYENNGKEIEKLSGFADKLDIVKQIVKEFETFLGVTIDPTEIVNALKTDEFTQVASYKLQAVLIKAAEDKVNKLRLKRKPSQNLEVKGATKAQSKSKYVIKPQSSDKE